MQPIDADTDLDCRTASQLLSLALERALDDGERAALRHHLGECLMCTNFEKQLAFLRAAAARFQKA